MNLRTLLLISVLIPSMLWGQADVDPADTTKNSFAIFPAVSYAPETSLQFGAVAIWVLKNIDTSQQEFLRQSSITPYFVYTFKKQTLAVFDVDYYFSTGQNLVSTLRYINFPDSYFGLGGDTDPDVSEQYTNRFFQWEGQYLKPVKPTMFVGIGYDLQFTSIRETIPDGLLETDDPIGLSGGSVLSVGPAFRYDSRDYTVYPSKGTLFTARVLYNGIGDFNFTSYLADFRRYISLHNEENILAFQVRAQFTSGTEVPFFKTPQLGGDERLRGISNASLYRDRQMVYTQVEYRRPLFWRFGMTVFAGVGEVGYNISDFSELKPIFGLGGRLALLPDQKLNARLDVGIGPNGQQGIYIGVSEAF